MKALLLTSVVVLAIFLVDLIRNDKRKYYYYILMFVLMFFANYIFSSTAEASENIFREYEYEFNADDANYASEIFSIPNSETEIKHLIVALNALKPLSKEDIKSYENKVKYHKEKADFLYEFTKKKV
ncbi:hypothetical protein [Parachlamydia acanthamoebae]|uniref:hypothetical protein n=1 Tax=Parachlamydia acanthamoebae TaxID=83552 RepID=UPI0007509F03|nr:hypothetical protein [Parachlamydia acanthamoebae]